MKRPILTTLLIFGITCGYPQQTSLTTNSKISFADHLLLKHKNFSSAEWTCKVGGNPVTVPGLGLFPHDDTFTSGFS
jgi:hypothetical protein